MKKIISLISLLFVLTGCNAIKSTTTNPTPLLNVATFNLRLAPKPESNMWQLRKDSCSQLVLAHNFDIFGTQEGFLHQLKDIEKYTGYKFIGRARDDGKTKGEYSAIFYNPARLKLLDKGDFWFAETPDQPVKGWDAACKRVCSWGKFKDRATSKEFYFFSLHFDHKGKIAREESAKLILKKIKEIAKNQTFFCVGDFNLHVEMQPMQIILKDPIIQDSKVASKTKPYGTEGTFHAFKGIPRGTRIDYILSSKNVDILSYAVITDKLTNFDLLPPAPKGKSNPQYPSDHFPILVRANIK